MQIKSRKGLTGGEGILLVLTIVGILVFAGILGPGIQTKSVIPPSNLPLSNDGANSQLCGSTGLANLGVKVQNFDNSSLEFISGGVSYVDTADGQFKGVLFAPYAGGNAPSYATASGVLTCGHAYDLYQLGNSSVVATKYQKYIGSVIQPYSAIVADEPQKQINLVGYKNLQVNFNTYTNGYANDTNGPANSQDYNVVNTVAQGVGSLTEKFDVGATGADGHFGASQAYYDADTGVNAAAYVCFFGNTSVVKASDVSLNYPGVVSKLTGSMPRWCQNNAPSGTSVVTAWVINPVIGNGRQSGTVTVNFYADPAASNPRFTWVNPFFYVNGNGQVVYGTADSSNNNLGQTNRYFALSVS